MADEDVLGFPGGPPHPPYGEPLRPSKGDERAPGFAGLPDSPPSGSPPKKTKPKKRRAKKKEAARATPLADGDSKKVPWWRKAGVGLLILASLWFRFCTEQEQSPGSDLLLGGANLFERVELDICESDLILRLPPEKEMPSAGPPSDPRAVTGKGIGEAVWAIRMGGIIEPYGLRARMWGENQQIVAFNDEEIALMHRITGAGAERANHFIGLSYSSGRVEWQELMLGGILGSTGQHVWLAATASERSSVIATVNMATGAIEDCFAAHSTQEEDPPPLFGSYDGVSLVSAMGTPTTSDEGLYVRPQGFEADIQYLTPGGDPTKLRIPAGQSLFAMLDASADIIAATPLEQRSPTGSLQGWSTQDLTRIWGVKGVGERVDTAITAAGMTVVHERARVKDVSFTTGVETATGEILWRTKHDIAFSSSVAGLHAHEGSAVLSAFDLDTNLATTTFMGAGKASSLERTFMDYAREDRIGLITQLESGESFGRVFSIGPKRKTIARLEEVGALLTFNEELVIVEITTQGEPWLVGIEFAPPQGGGGGGKGKGKSKGGGDKKSQNEDQDEKKGKGGGGGGGGGQGDDEDDGPPST